MKDLKEVLDKSSEIVSLAERFNFDSDVRILVEEGSVRSNQTLLNLLVRVAPEKEITVYNTTFLSLKLTELLGCDVFITLHEGVKDLYKKKVIERSLPLTASPDEFCKLFGIRDIKEIFFKKPSKHVEAVLLKEANKYLDEHPLKKPDTPQVRALAEFGLSPEQKKHRRDPELEEESQSKKQEGSTDSPVKDQAAGISLKKK